MSVVTENDKVEMTVRVLKCAENDKYCVDFTRREGDQLEFFNVFNNAKQFFGEFTLAVMPGPGVIGNPPWR